MELGPALVGGLVGGTIAAIVTALIALAQQGRQHAHEASMAREERNQERRSRAYVGMLEHAYYLLLWAERTEPIIGPMPDPPDSMPDSEFIKLNALLSAYASPAVRAIAADVKAAARAVQAGIWMVQFEREHPTAEGANRWRELTDARKALGVAIDRMSEQIYAELST